MASKTMITKALAARTDAQARIPAEGETARALIRTIDTWLETAMYGGSDRECEWAADWSPARRTLRGATRQLPEWTEAA